MFYKLSLFALIRSKSILWPDNAACPSLRLECFCRNVSKADIPWLNVMVNVFKKVLIYFVCVLEKENKSAKKQISVSYKKYFHRVSTILTLNFLKIVVTNFQKISLTWLLRGHYWSIYLMVNCLKLCHLHTLKLHVDNVFNEHFILKICTNLR